MAISKAQQERLVKAGELLMAISKAQQERLVKAGELLEDAFESIVIVGIDVQHRRGAWLHVRDDRLPVLQEAAKEAFEQVKKRMCDRKKGV